MKKIVEMKFGSHLYGLQTPESDTDYKGIYLPTVDDLVFGAQHSILHSTGGEGKNTKDDVGYEFVSIQKFIKDALNGQTYTLDMLHCQTPSHSSEVWEFLVENRKAFYTQNMKAYMGYVKQQAAKYGIKGSRLADIKGAIDTIKEFLPTATLGDVSVYLYEGEYANIVTVHNKKTGTAEDYYEVNGKKYQFTNTCEYVVDRLQKMYDGYGARAKLAEKNEGVDWKAISHALRAGYQLRAIYQNGDFKYPLVETGFLLKVKKGELDFQYVSWELEELMKQLEALSGISKLPLKADEEFWLNYVKELYKQ